jgi:hypothetical protein
MTHPLVELSRTKHQTSAHLVIEDYDKHPTICRHGIWVGWSVTFTETVVLSFEHDPEELYVGWAINGTTVIDPGYSSGTPPWGYPAPGAPSVTYVTPVDGFFHRLSLTSTSGSGEVCLWVQVLYRGPSEAGAPAHYGPAMGVCLSGAEVIWPAYKLEEEKRCLAAFFDLLRRYVEVAHVNPGDPVEKWLARLRGEEAVRMKAELETLQKIDPKANRELADAIKADLARMLRARIPGAGGFPGLASNLSAGG